MKSPEKNPVTKISFSVEKNSLNFRSREIVS